MISNTPKFPNFISGLFRILYVLLWIVGGFLVLMAVVLPWASGVKDDFCRIPVTFALKDTPITFEIGYQAYDAGLVRSGGLLKIEEGPLWLSYVNLLVYFVIFGVLLYCLRLSIHIIDRVRGGQPFALENALALRRIAVASLCLFGFFILLRLGFLFFASGRIVSGPLVAGIVGSGLEFDLSELILPLFLLVLAEAFKAGAVLKEEQDLTI